MGQVSFSAVRVRKVRTSSDAVNSTKHGQRKKGYLGKSRIDPERTHLNQHWVFDNDAQGLERVAECPNYHKAIEDRRKQVGATRAKNGVFGTEMMFIASRDVFLGDDGQIDDEIAAKWAKDCLELAEKKYPGMCVAARLDLDETTPHLSIFMMPHYEKTYGGEKRQSKRVRKPKVTLSHNKVFGGPDNLSHLQDWAADGLKNRGWDVNRGIPVEVTRAKNARPDGAAYAVIIDIWQKLKRREEYLARRDEKITAWVEQVSQALMPFRDLMPEKLRTGLDFLISAFEKEKLEPTEHPDVLIKKALSRKKERIDEPAAPKL